MGNPTVTISLREATPEEFTIKKNQIVLGKLFFLKSIKTGFFDSGIYYTYDGMNLDDLRTWFINKMVYVPVSPLEAMTINNN